MADFVPLAGAKFHRERRLIELLDVSFAMIVIIALVVILLGLILIFDTTDVPYIKHLPSVPGFPILGNLSQLGSEQPRRLAVLSKKHGPVFQIRLGNKVSHH